MNEKLKRCKELRLEAKKTQADLAKELGVSRVYVNMVENGKGNKALLIKYWTDKGYKL